MARYSKRLTSLLLTSLLLTACQEGGEAGDLHGQWRLTGTEYIAFSGSVTVLRSTAGGWAQQVYGNFQHTGDSLFIQCYSAKELPSDTTMVEETFGFKPLNNICLKIEALNADQLTLSKNGQTWHLHKY